MCWEEIHSLLQQNLFCKSSAASGAGGYEIEDLDQGGAGVRAQALSPTGELVQDFCFGRQPRALHVLNAPSPAATASLAIADEIIDQLQDAIAS